MLKILFILIPLWAQAQIVEINPARSSEKFRVQLINTLSVLKQHPTTIGVETFNSVSPVITTVFSIIQISPFTLIFIGFMNYWNLCCLYSILDVKVPGYLPEIHEKIF